MLDIWLIGIAMVLAVAAFPLVLVTRIRPHLAPGSGVHLMSEQDVEDKYRRRTRLSRILRLFWAGLLAYLLLRAFVFPPREAKFGFGDSDTALALALAVLAASFTLATFVRYFMDRRFCREHPEFQSSFVPLGTRVLSLAVVLVPFGILGLGFLADGIEVTLLCVGLALIVLSFGQRLQINALIRRQVPVLPGTPLFEKVEEVVKAFGYTPKRFVLVPNLVANGGALPDGTVLVTTALRTIATDEEIAGVIAHELSHVRDRDAKRLRARRWLALFLIALVGAGCGAALGFARVPSALVAPLIFAVLMNLVPFVSWFIARQSQPMEFKCDADAEALGLGPELASCLEKLHRFAGIPREWSGVDRVLVTHPSLADRVHRLRKGKAPGAPSLAEVSS